MNNTRINKIRQIVTLRQIMRKWHARALSRKVSTVNGCALSPRYGGGSSLSYDSDEECCRRPPSPPPDVPEGYLAVYVGSEERRRFIIPTSYLSLPVFRTLLDKAEEEFGFDHKGGLTIPCEIAVFEDVLRVLATNDHGGEEIVLNINFCKAQEINVYSTPLQEKSFG
uniref:TSA: Wollemia nobilis Ref_Wollemi_Transcript_4547_918 transcribed RNA sequence n=1 Tax=Wollemia nobilis TaxID=56998 RepID=A0A0C9RY09_9CONI